MNQRASSEGMSEETECTNIDLTTQSERLRNPSIGLVSLRYHFASTHAFSAWLSRPNTSVLTINALFDCGQPIADAAVLLARFTRDSRSLETSG
jgi:hypothetical protein